MEKLSLEEFNLLPKGKVFATGILPNSPEGLYMTDYNKGKELRWVAKNGRFNDWAVYCHWADKSEEWVMAYGDKIIDAENILKCVDCTEEVLDLYRY